MKWREEAERERAETQRSLSSKIEVCPMYVVIY